MDSELVSDYGKPSMPTISVDDLGFDPLQFIGIAKVNNQEFLIQHKEDESQDIHVTCDIDEDSETVEWEGLSEVASKKLGKFDFTLQQKYPVMCLNTLLMQAQQIVRGLRPEATGSSPDESIATQRVRKMNPFEKYAI